MEKNKQKNLFIVGLIVFAALAFFAFFASKYVGQEPGGEGPIFSGGPVKTELNHQMEKFKSEADFKKYLAEGAKVSGSNSRGFGGGPDTFMGTGETALPSANISMDAKSGSAVPFRVSETNVQVKGVDEPDIIKTDGQEIYYSRILNQLYYNELPARGMPPEEKSIMPPNYNNSRETLLIKGFPLESLGKENKIDNAGELLLEGKTLVVISQDQRRLTAYDVADPKNTQEKWNISLQDKNFLLEARKLGKDIYLIARKEINGNSHCPFDPVVAEGKTYAVSCGDIYHPGTIISVDLVYTAMAVDIDTGKIKKSVSFVGSANNSVIYMNGKNIYATYQYSGNVADLMVDFLLEQKDLFPEDVINKLRKLKSYELSSAAKQAEISAILEQYDQVIDSDERRKVENETENRLAEYTKKHLRDFERTGIAKISVKDFKIEATGSIPGRLLNQFSLDEYEGNLRAATTVGGTWFFQGQTDTANDIYVLNKDLEQSGSILDLGKEEKIYSARFIGNKGYLVTFRQVDPFFVLDLADPENPKKAGELKIPGYSSYLHPLEENLILGAGKEGLKVKLSLFDVSSADDPKEVSKFTLDEYWSEALDNHHAFMADNKYKVIFVPGGQGGYVFSYEGSALVQKVAVGETEVQRALYINDYLYVVGKNGISVYNEKNWEKVKELDF